MKKPNEKSEKKVQKSSLNKLENIVLIGFMGVGKGAVARELSRLSGRFAIDGDDMIESLFNKKIAKIFEEEGEEAFRTAEKNLASFLENNVTGAIISTGGGFYKQRNLKKIGKIVYLKSSFEKIMERLQTAPNSEKKLAKRPLLKDLEKAKKLHKERNRAYARKADIIVLTENKSPKKIAKEILKALKVKK